MELPTRFTPAEHELELYAAWEASGGFQPRPDSESGGRRFTVMIPPPNVTGALHMGHALNGTVQDIVIRHRRMQGYSTLWLPGTDHAGIATQAVVERMLAERGQKREELGREAFLKEVWAWKDQYGARILEQFRRLGCSCDWTRTRFTMETHMSRAVREAFVRLYDKGYVYRGMRLVNWDCVLGTAVSDDEIEHVTRKSKLYYLKYPVEGQPGRLVVVATTRPETMLGDTGVAVHPADERYAELVGKHVVLPFLGRRIPIFADDSVEPAYGTGAVKVTPGHDPADYARGQRHGLPILTILEKDGRISAEGGQFAGKSREEARKLVVAGLDELELLEKVEEITHNLALSDRSKTPIEPLVSEQWFVRMEQLAAPAIAAVKSGKLRFTPERWTKVYLDWLEKVQDWCISRQLWWGHQIPVWYDEDGLPAASREDLAIGSAHPVSGKPIVRQDPDVLDTWASSWLWPFATLGWPDQTEDLARFYPTQFLSTAREIIYLWVARMVMAGYEFLDHLPVEERCPFEVCNIHATVLDGQGRRMSKQAGNGIDPIDMIDEYGADAVRLCLVLLTREGQDTKLSPDKFEQGRRFCNKVWNAARFVMLNLEGGERTDGSSDRAPRLEDRWILSRLSRTLDQVTRDLEAYRFNDAAMALYRFVWNDYCDWYLELAKPRLVDAADPSGPAARGILARVLRDVLGMLHPITPFLTEKLWAALHGALGEPRPGLLMNAAWPRVDGARVDAEAEQEMALVQEVLHAVRQVRTLTQAGERVPLGALLSAPREEDRRVLLEHAGTVRALGFLADYDVVAQAERPPASAVASAGSVQVFVALGEAVDTERLRAVLEKRMEKLRKGGEATAKKLANQGFVRNADPELIEAERARLAELELEITMLEQNLAGL